MKPILKVTAKALVDIAQDLPAENIAPICDAVLQILQKHGVTAYERRQFLSIVRKLTEEQGALEVSVTTPLGSLGDQTASLLQALTSALKRPVSLKESAAPELIGGALLSFQDERYDATVRGALRALEHRLTSA